MPYKVRELVIDSNMHIINLKKKKKGEGQDRINDFSSYFKIKLPTASMLVFSLSLLYFLLSFHFIPKKIFFVLFLFSKIKPTGSMSNYVGNGHQVEESSRIERSFSHSETTPVRTAQLQIIKK